MMQPKSLPELRSKGIAFDVQPVPVWYPAQTTTAAQHSASLLREPR